MRKEKKSYRCSRKIVVVIVIFFLLVLNPFAGLSVKAALTITSPSSTSLTDKSVSISAQTTTGTISGVEVSDDGNAGWVATIASTHFTRLADHKLLAGSNNTATFSGTYDVTYGILDPPGTYIVEIITEGSVGTSKFNWTAPDGIETENVNTASTVTLSKGISVNFGTATYVAGDKWSVAVDVFSYTGLTVTPGSITIVSGDTGVTAGTAEALTGVGETSDAKTIMTGEAGNSTGTYRQNESLELNIHADSSSGSFTATATLTVL